MDEAGFVQKQNSCKLVVLKVSSNVWSKCANANFHMTFFICVSPDNSYAPPLLALPGKRLNKDVLKGCNIEGDNIKTAPKCFINYILFLS